MVAHDWLHGENSSAKNVTRQIKSLTDLERVTLGRDDGKISWIFDVDVVARNRCCQRAKMKELWVFGSLVLAWTQVSSDINCAPEFYIVNWQSDKNVTHLETNRQTSIPWTDICNSGVIGTIFQLTSTKQTLLLLHSVSPITFDITIQFRCNTVLFTYTRDDQANTESQIFLQLSWIANEVNFCYISNVHWD